MLVRRKAVKFLSQHPLFEHMQMTNPLLNEPAKQTQGSTGTRTDRARKRDEEVLLPRPHRELPHARHSDLVTSTGVPTSLNMRASYDTSCCSGPSVVTLGKRAYCRKHFIQTCYKHLEECAEKFKGRDQADKLVCDRRRHSLQEIVDQSTATSLTHGDLSNLERNQLLDIVRWGGDLIRQTRRGSRKQDSIPVRLYLESSSQTCAEETLVREVSQHGAALTCSFPIIVGELVKIERMDTGERVEGIVRWRKRRDGTTLHLGLEFSYCNNFWRLHW